MNEEQERDKLIDEIIAEAEKNIYFYLMIFQMKNLKHQLSKN